MLTYGPVGDAQSLEPDSGSCRELEGSGSSQARLCLCGREKSALCGIRSLAHSFCGGQSRPVGDRGERKGQACRTDGFMLECSVKCLHFLLYLRQDAVIFHANTSQGTWRMYVLYNPTWPQSPSKKSTVMIPTLSMTE